ncbi:MAG: class I SAM-dependent methyltransferase [Chlamydiae bacterium]|nr:class I SAM-dependent methyltransferase [Chlamydiota bacterium]
MTIQPLCLFFLLILASLSAEDAWNGDAYAKHSSLQKTQAELLLSRIAWEGDEVVLDLGCGDGRMAACLADTLPRGKVVGLDPSLSMLQSAQKFQAPNLSFIQGRAEDFSLEERFDHVIAVYVMHWVQEQIQALQNIRLHLKEGGRFHFIIAPSKEGLPFDRALKKVLSRACWKQAFVDFVNPKQDYDIETYRKLVLQSGLHLEELHYFYDRSVHPTFDSLKQWVKQWLPHGKYLASSSIELQEVFLSELLQAYLQEIGLPENTQGPIYWEEYILLVEGRN